MKPSFPIRQSLLASALALAAGAGVAGESADGRRMESFILAEIVVPGQTEGTQKAKKSASDVRAKARAYKESESGTPVLIVAPEDEEEAGLLGPRQHMESGASQNRAKARQYQQGQSPAPAQPGAQETGSADRAQENRAKARSYVSTDNKLLVQRVGSDGIPIVDCSKMASNVAGHIGDDLQPGALFFVMRDNKPYKVRCAQ